MTWNQKGKMAFAAWALGIVTALPSPCRADNPIVQTNYTADPAPMVYDGRLYLYTSHDDDATVDNFYTMNDWRLYSTADMVNWTDHGSPAGLKTFSWGTDNAWAPQGIARNGKFYLYVPLNNNTGARIGVGVSTNPAGPFTDPLGKALAQSGTGNIDPTVFVDDDGQAYMYWGNGTLRYVKLNSDMISTSGSVTNVSMSEFVEGPWFYKRGSLYYLVYAAGSGNEKISYATSNGPTGPWTARGDVMAAGSIFTNHPGVVDYKGHSYFFYHNGALPNGGTFKRSVCVEEFTYGADGSIPKLTMSKAGPTAVATLNPFAQVEAETIAFSSGLKTEVCTDTGGGINVKSISNGDYIKVKDVDFLDGVTSFDARVSSAGSNAKIELHLDSQTGTLLGTCDVSGVSSWTTKTCSVSGGQGKHDLFLTFTGGSGDLLKFNWWKFTGPTVPPGGAGGGGGSAGSHAGGGVATNGGTANTSGGSAGKGGNANSSSGRGGTANGGTANSSSASSGNAPSTTMGGARSSSNGGSATTTDTGKSTVGGSAIGTGGNTSASGGTLTATGGASVAASSSHVTTGTGAATSSAHSGTSSKDGTGGNISSAPGSNATGANNADGGSGCSCRVSAAHGNRDVAAAWWLVASAFLMRRRGADNRSRSIRS